jgi:hypothetical protein
MSAELDKANEIIDDFSNTLHDYIGDYYDRRNLARQLSINFINGLINELEEVYCFGENDIDERIIFYENVKQIIITS